MIRLEEKQEDDLQINMAPMIDMVFLLIIFFLTATTFTQREREQDILLPSNTSAGSLSRNFDTSLIINVLKDGSVRALGKKVDEKELLSLVRDRKERARSTLKVMVRADRRTAYGNVAQVLGAVERAGVQRPYVVTRMVDLEP